MDSDPDITVRSSEIAPMHSDDQQCAPALDFKDGSCIPLDALVDLAEAYNGAITTKEMKGKKIKLHQTTNVLRPTKYKRYLVKKFKHRLDKLCDNQQCWLKQRFMNNLKGGMRNYMKKMVFRPKGPSGRFDWLNTFNIEQAMKQYEDKHSDFLFLGAVPMDFDELTNLPVKKFDFARAEKDGKTKIGIIYNLDEHYKSGSHWVAGYNDLSTGKVYYFDSYGIRPEKRVREFMKRVAKHCYEKGVKPDVQYNDHRHQRKNTECGVYSMNFIIRMLGGETFDEITANKTSDDQINKCRDVYFS